MSDDSCFYIYTIIITENLVINIQIWFKYDDYLIILHETICIYYHFLSFPFPY